MSRSKLCLSLCVCLLAVGIASCKDDPTDDGRDSGSVDVATDGTTDSSE